MLSTAIVTGAALLILNVIDFRRYYRAAHFEQTEGLEKVRELARACFEVSLPGAVAR